MKFIAFLLVLFTNFATAAKLSLVCDTFPYDIETESSQALTAGKVRYVGQTTVAFLDADSFSRQVVSRCSGFGESKICNNTFDKIFCKKPQSEFKLRSLRDDNSIVMISDRCDGTWTKYQLIGEKKNSGNELAYMEETTFFQLKNQIYQGVDIQRDKPVFIISNNDGINFDAKLVSFQKEMWNVDSHDALQGKLKSSLEAYENGLHETISLSSTCSPK